MSAYRGQPCPDCHAEGRIEACEACSGAGTLLCDLCGGNGVRRVVQDGEARTVPCLCHNGYFTCAACSGGTGVCGRCGGTGFLEGR
jgi:RecJ-like exonuclease